MDAYFKIKQILFAIQIDYLIFFFIIITVLLV